MKHVVCAPVENFLDLLTPSTPDCQLICHGRPPVVSRHRGSQSIILHTPVTAMSLLSTLRRKAPLVIAATLPLLFGSCATEGLLNAQGGALGALGRTQGAAGQNRFMADQQRTVGEGTAVGAGAGMVVAAALGRRLGPLGSLAVIAGGALAGNLIGQHVAMKKALAAQTSANLDAAIKEAEGENAKARQRLTNLRQQLASLQAKGRAAKAAGDTKTVTKVKADLLALQKSVASDRSSIDQSITMQTQLQSKVPSSNPKYSAISGGLSESTKTRASYDSLHGEIGSAINEL